VYSHFSSTGWITPFGLMFIAAILTAWFLARRNAAARGVDPSHVDLVLPLTVIVGVIGGVAVASLMPSDYLLAGEAMNHGLRIRLFGMLGTGALGVFVYSRLAGLSFRQLLDIFALPTLAGLAIHRIGCHFAGCCWGDIVRGPDAGALATQVQTTSLLQGIVDGIRYPAGSLPYEQHVALGLIEPGAVASLPVYPVQLFEVAGLLILILLLSRVARRDVASGTLAVLTIVGYAAMRFLIGYWRADGSIVLGNLTITQLQCLVLVSSILLLPRLRRSVVS
jgi:phosphatidylglycerol---prolipoprotein diacylglyceryl transferase